MVTEQFGILGGWNEKFHRSASFKKTVNDVRIEGHLMIHIF